MKLMTRVGMATTAGTHRRPCVRAAARGDAHQDDNPGTTHQPSTKPTQGTNPGTANKLAAAGVYCKEVGASKKAEGQTKSPFATCVVAAKNLSADKKAQEESAPAEW